jgi:raffinose/stachyose/melibiose transport system permease protein
MEVDQGGGARGAVAPKGSSKRAPGGGLRRRRMVAWLFMLPLVVVNVLVILGPSVATIYYSFTDWSGLGPAEFVGLQNYRDILTDGDFYVAMWHNVVWTILFLTVPISMGLLGAFLLSQITRFHMFFRVAYFVPYVVASVVNAALWQNILDPDRGIGSALASVGIPFLDGVSFFGSQILALPSVAGVNIWAWWGFLVLLFLTALQSVDAQLYEAAKIDGAGRWQQFLNVTLPGIRPTLVFVVLLTIINSLLVFDYVYIITRGGPAGASEVVGTLMYKEAFERFEAGYASAMGLGLSFVSGLIVLVFIVLRRRGWEV